MIIGETQLGRYPNRKKDPLANRKVMVFIAGGGEEAQISVNADEGFTSATLRLTPAEAESLIGLLTVAIEEARDEPL